MAANLIADSIPASLEAETQVFAGSLHSGQESHECGHHSNHNPALLALVSDAQATHVAIGSGNWSDPAIWRDGVTPTQGARIVIAEGQTVTVDQVFNQQIFIKGF